MADMSLKGMKTHPLMVIAATAVILTCLVALGMMMGIIPTPSARERAQDATVQERATTPANRLALNQERTPLRAPGTPSRTGDRAPVGSTSGAGPTNTVGNTVSEPKVAAVCTNCGTVSSVRVVKQQGDASMVGPGVGAAIGGLAGNQIGSGSGRTVATVVGAGVGAAVGTEVERRYVRSTTSYVVGVRMTDGTTRSFTYQAAPGFEQGDKVRVVDGRLQRDS